MEAVIIDARRVTLADSSYWLGAATPNSLGTYILSGSIPASAVKDLFLWTEAEAV
jgi:hypothetical protein